MVKILVLLLSIAFLCCECGFDTGCLATSPIDDLENAVTAPQDDEEDSAKGSAPIADPAPSPNTNSGSSEPVAQPVFVDGEAQIVDAFNHPRKWIWHDLFVETEFDSDGSGAVDRMHVSVCRPEQTKTEGLKVPVIYATSPYYSGTSSTDNQFMWNPEQELGQTPPTRENPPEIQFQDRRRIISRQLTSTWVPRGFAVVHSESPGTGFSQGCPTCGGKNEALAPKAVIDWLCGRARGFTTLEGDQQVFAEWCNGCVGMTGTSYNGTLPIAAATTGVEGLKAIIPVAPNTSYYHYYRSNGLVRHPGGYMGEDIDVLYNFIHSGDPARREYCNTHIRDQEMQGHQDRVTGDYNSFWAGRDYLNQVDGIQAAVLMAHGFNDWNVMPEHSYRIYSALKARGVPVQCYYHQGGHGGDPPIKMMNRWFTRYLYGIENDVEKDPKAWIVRETDTNDKPTPYPDYPHPDAQPVTLRPVMFNYRNTVQTLSLHQRNAEGSLATLTDNVALTGAELATAAENPHRLLFATAPLQQPVHLSGVSRLHLRLAVDRPAANVSIWLVSLPWSESDKINANLITRGWADPQNAQSLTDSQPLVPNQFYDLMFDLQPDDQIIPVGQQIGLMIFSSDRDFTLWPKPGTRLTVDTHHTWIDLPIVGGVSNLEAALSDQPQP